MKKIEITVKGMSCSHCENRVNQALLAIDGVKSAKASAKKSLVAVKFDEAKILEETLKSAIKEAGYEVE